MTISKEQHETIIKERDDIIAKLEEDLEKQIEKLDKLVDEVSLTKTATNDLIDLIDYKNQNHVIANISNFLSEQNKVNEASTLSKCKLGKILISPSLLMFGNGNRFIQITIILYCPGDSFEKMKNDIWGDPDIHKEYHSAFKAYYTLSNVRELYLNTFDNSSARVARANGVDIRYELNIKRISPKDSDGDVFFQKVDCLKKMLKR